jgi:hypothetical protein
VREKPNLTWAKRYGSDFSLVLEFLDTSEQKRRDEEEAIRQRAEEERQREEEIRRRELAQAQALAEEQRRRAEVQAMGNARLRRLIMVLIGVLLLAMGAALFAWTQKREAVTARNMAEERQKEAEEAKSSAERFRSTSLERQKEAEEAKSSAERLRFTSLVQALTAQALRQLITRQDERGSLLARQAYLFNQQSDGYVLGQVDEALRTLLSTPYFSHILRGHEGDVTSVSFSPDGKGLASGSEDKTVRV